MADDVAIHVSNVSKTFKLPHERHNSIKGALINFARRKRGYEKQQVLKNVSFEVKKGEFFGIVGRNGSGKSTLLKLLAGIYSPDSGAIHINGKLTPFIELGVGFNPELTGRENVFLNGALLGFNRKEMEAMYDDIVEFAELRRFMDQKLKNYSSGMQVRLAFSIAIRAQSDILLLDEVLAVGDENFQRKCYDYFGQLKRNKQTVIFISHDMSAVRDYCDRALLLDRGEIAEQGATKSVVAKYTELNFKTLEADIDQDTAMGDLLGGDGAKIEKVWTSLDGKKQNAYRPRQRIQVHIAFKANIALETPVIGIAIQDAQGRVIFATNTLELQQMLKDISAGQRVVATFSLDNIYTNGNYSVSCAVANRDRSKLYARIEDAHKFAIGGWPASMEHSITHPEHTFTIE